MERLSSGKRGAPKGPGEGAVEVAAGGLGAGGRRAREGVRTVEAAGRSAGVGERGAAPLARGGERADTAEGEGSGVKRGVRAAGRGAHARGPSGGGRGAAAEARGARKRDSGAGGRALTTADLVLLSLLAERSMHGYQAYTVLEFRQARDWAGVSRPQVYYSLEKLARLGMVKQASSEEESGGPERAVFETTAKGRGALADALEREDWTEQIERPAFLTWMALSWQCRGGVFQKQLERRRRFLESELARKREILAAVKREVGHRFHEAVWMLNLSLEQIRSELRWLKKVATEVDRRARARRPAYPA